MRYWPNPAHKSDTTEAGPPVWSPDKEKCPRGMTIDERDDLLVKSIPIDDADPTSRRFVARRTERGLEIYDIKFTRMVGDDAEFHGHPATRIDRRVLRKMRDAQIITHAEFRRLLRELPGC
jgi:hypothetical protein